MASGLRGRCFHPCVHVTGAGYIIGTDVYNRKVLCPQWNVSNCFLSKYINAICTCIYANDIKAAGVWQSEMWCYEIYLHG